MNAERFYYYTTLCRANKRALDALGNDGELDEEQQAQKKKYEKNYKEFCDILDAEIERVNDILKSRKTTLK